MVRLAGAIALALVARLVIDWLARIVCDVRDPVGQARQALRDAGPGAQILSARLHLVEGGLSLIDRLVAIALADVGPVAVTGGEWRQKTNTGNEEGHGRAQAIHRPSITWPESCRLIRPEAGKVDKNLPRSES